MTSLNSGLNAWLKWRISGFTSVHLYESIRKSFPPRAIFAIDVAGPLRALFSIFMLISDLQTGLVKQKNVVDVPKKMSPLGTRKVLFSFRYKVRCRTTLLFDR